MTLFVSN